MTKIREFITPNIWKNSFKELISACSLLYPKARKNALVFIVSMLKKRSYERKHPDSAL
jgi:hypothetical protein